MNPVTDRYLSSDTFRFIVDGYEHSRTERANIVKDWKVGLENLRVCWQNKEDLSQNCGHCEKCIRTKLNFLASGVSCLPAMSKQFSIDDIKNDKITDLEANSIAIDEMLKTKIVSKNAIIDLIEARKVEDSTFLENVLNKY